MDDWRVDTKTDISRGRDRTKGKYRREEEHGRKKDLTDLLYLRPVLVLLVVLTFRHLDDLKRAFTESRGGRSKRPQIELPGLL
jgi:TRAP-type uncharacterized transport system fused permease subunit